MDLNYLLNYLEDKFSPGQIEEIKKGLIDNVNVAKYARPEYSISDMFRMRNSKISVREDFKNKKIEIDNLAKCKDKTYYEKFIDYSDSMNNIVIWDLINGNTEDGNRNAIVEKYVDRIPNEAFKSLCDAENLYDLMDRKVIDWDNKPLLELTIEAYKLVIEQMFYAIFKNNVGIKNIRMECARENLRNLTIKYGKNDFTDFCDSFYNELWKIQDLSLKIVRNEASEKDVEFLRNFLFEIYPTDGEYKCNMDILLEAVENNPWDNKKL